MMNFESWLFILMSMIIGYVGQRYKDMSTIKYAVFISFMLLLAFLIIAITDGGFFVSLKFTLTLSILVVAFSTAIFHWQKKCS